MWFLLVLQLSVSAPSAPLPTNAAQETGGNLATIASALGAPAAAAPAKAAVVAGVDGGNLARPLLTTAQGVLVVQALTLPAFPLPPCNPVRRVNCQK